MEKRKVKENWKKLTWAQTIAVAHPIFSRARPNCWIRGRSTDRWDRVADCAAMTPATHRLTDRGPGASGLRLPRARLLRGIRVARALGSYVAVGRTEHLPHAYIANQPLLPTPASVGQPPLPQLRISAAIVAVCGQGRDFAGICELLKPGGSWRSATPRRPCPRHQRRFWCTRH
jgi:hypothetical protein